MPATTRSHTIPASSRRLIGAALGLVLVVGAAPFLNSASAAQPAGDATPAAETAPASAKTVNVSDPAIWVNPQDPTKSLVLGANGTDGLAVYDMTGAAQAQPDISDAPVSGVDTHNGFMLGGAPVSLAMSVGEGGDHGLMHFA